MGLFGFGKKREPCAVCGGEVKGLFPWKIEGQLICDGCHGTIDMDPYMSQNMNMELFLEYKAFREENETLKQQFVIEKKIDFGFFDTKMVFDGTHKLMCFDDSLCKTVFRGSEIASFAIKEDATPLFEGSTLGLRRHISTVPERVNAMMPQINQIIAQRQMQHTMQQIANTMNRDDDRDGGWGRDRDNNQNRPPQPPRIDLPEPFKKFNLEVHFKHPYWKKITADMDGPNFDNHYPDVNDYLNRYHQSVDLMEELALALMEVAFPNAPQQTLGGEIFEPAAPVSRSIPVSAPEVDAVNEIKRYKELMDQGIITEEEFSTKKRQILGI